MNQQQEKQIRVYGGKVYGFKVSDYGLKNGYLDYYTLSKIVGDSILCNEIIPYVGYENWELIAGDVDRDDYFEVYQYYIITEFGYQFLQDYTDELVYYNEPLNMYLWGITHFGTSWDYVLTDIKLVIGDDK